MMMIFGNTLNTKDSRGDYVVGDATTRAASKSRDEYDGGGRELQ